MSSHQSLETIRFAPQVGDPAPFPDSGRVIYAKNPLESVICQLRFPAILKIGAEAPVDFQEALRRDYPLFREIPPIDMGTGLPPEISSVVSKLLPVPPSKAYELSSADGFWRVTLTQESLALSCMMYSRWEQFKESLMRAFALLERIYVPPFFTRVGLRYRDVITRHRLGLADTPWGELLSQGLAGEFHGEIAGAVEATGHQVVLRMQGESRVTLQHGLGYKDREVCYIIDSDYYVGQRTGVEDAVGILDYFNRQAGRVFRWCITDRLHEALEPGPVS